MTVRQHEPVTIEKFMGYFDRGGNENVPEDHWSDVANVTFIDEDFRTRDGIEPYQTVVTKLKNILRVHPYKMQTGQTRLVLVAGGDIYHVVNPGTVFGPILSIATMTDFNTVSIAGRAYITPFFTNANGQEVGISGEFLYVYDGTGAAARKAAGPVPAGTLTIGNGAAGFTDAGLHTFGVVGETDTGYLSPPIALNNFTTSASNSVSFSNIPVFVGSFWTKRHIVASKVIQDFNGDNAGYQLFFIPNATVNDNVTTTLNDISFYDSELIDDASHLLENFSEIPAGVGLTTYHGRLVLTTTFNDISIAYVSEPGEPEAINQVDGILIVPLDGKPLTNCQEFRDILYLFKDTRTIGYSDNNDVPSTWISFVVDEGVGAPVHGVASVLDAGGVNVDYLMIGDYSGILLFNGAYSRPEFSFKIKNFWLGLDRSSFRELELINDSVSERLYVVLPTNILLVGDYSNGIDLESVKWSKWTFAFPITSVELTDTNTLLVAGTPNASNQSGLYQMTFGRTNDRLYDNADALTNVKIPDPFIITAYYPQNSDEATNHFTGIRLRVLGTGNLRASFLSLSDTESITLNPLVMAAATNVQRFQLTNFMQQRARLKLQTTAIDEIFRINRMNIYIKPVFSMHPA